ncbi:MAG: 3'-5' exonuclease [Dermatophilaceae bacterium]
MPAGYVINAGVDVGQSAAIHGLTDDQIASGSRLDDVVPEILAALRGRVLLAHYTDIEERFLSAACERLYGSRMPVARVDTLELHRRLIVGWGESPMRLVVAAVVGARDGTACPSTRPTKRSSTPSRAPSSTSPRSPNSPSTDR